MAGQAVAFSMAGDAALQILPCRLSVTQEERPFGIVIPGIQLPPSAEAALYVAIGAELAWVMAIAAARLP